MTYPTSQGSASGATPTYQAISLVAASSITASVTSQASSAVSSTTKFVQLTSSGAVWIAVGATPTASIAGAGCIYLPANVPVNVSVIPSVTKIAVILETAATGHLTIVESA